MIAKSDEEIKLIYSIGTLKLTSISLVLNQTEFELKNIEEVFLTFKRNKWLVALGVLTISFGILMIFIPIGFLLVAVGSTILMIQKKYYLNLKLSIEPYFYTIDSNIYFFSIRNRKRLSKMITKINHAKSLNYNHLVKVNEKDAGIINGVTTTEDDHSYVDLTVEVVDRTDYISIKYKSDTTIYIKVLYFKEGDYVQINEPILLFESDERFDNGEFSKQLISPVSGFISFMVAKSIYRGTRLEENEIKIFKEDIFRQRNKYPVHSELEIDEFSKIVTYKWKKLDLGQRLYFYPSNVDGGDYINFGFPFKDFNLSAGSSIHLLMSNSEIINIKVINNPSKLSQSEKLIKTPIALGELELLCKHSVEKVRLNLSTENQIVDIIITDDYYVLKKDLQFMIRSTFSDYLEFVSRLQNHRPLKDVQENFQEDAHECYVYLMKDFANEFYKIGISNDPKYRERTLQSEKPTIELIGSKKFPTRKIAESFEKALHEAFKEKRLRGEWFELTKDEARQIEISLI